MRIAFHREGLALTHSRESTAQSSMGGKVEVRLPFGLSEADDDRATPPADGVILRLDPARGHDAPTGPSTVVAALRASTGRGRLDPARGNDDGDWWPRASTEENQAAAAESGSMLGQIGEEVFEVAPVPPRQKVYSVPNTWECELDSAPLTSCRHETASDSAGRRWWSWMSRLRALGRLRLFTLLHGQMDFIIRLLSERSAPATPASGPDDLREALPEGIRAADIRVLGTAAAASDRPSDPPFSSETASELSPCEPHLPPSVAGLGGPAPAKAANSLSSGERGPAFLFAGEMSYAAGIDILADALVTVCQRHQYAQFVLVGDGPLKCDMEARVAGAGFSHRCRFTGDLPSDEFEKLVATCDVVVIPARESQDSGLAERAVSLGKPVLTTHQAQVRGIVHGHNGLVAYDCANSLVWGLQELLTKPLPACPQSQPDERQAA